MKQRYRVMRRIHRFRYAITAVIVGCVTFKHSALAALVATLWGVNFVVIDEGLKDVPPLLFLAIRFTLVAFPAVFFIRPPAIGWKAIVGIGSFMSLGQFSLLYIALELGMPAGVASLVLQAQVMLTILLAALFLGERPSNRQFFGVAVGMFGLVLVTSAHGLTAPWLPGVITLAAAFSWAIGNVLSRRAKAASGLGLVVWSGLVVPLPCLALSLLIDGPAEVSAALTNISMVAVLSTLYTAIGSSLIGYGIWNSLMARYATSSVVPFMLLVPVVGIASAWLFQSEIPTAPELFGGTIMLIGLAVATWTRTSRRKVSPAPPTVNAPS